jgi:hypothetical protein
VSGSDPVDPALGHLLDDPAVWAEVTPDLRERTLVAALGAAAPSAARPEVEAEAAAGRGVDGDSGPAGGREAGPADELAARRARRRGWQRPAALVAAAAVAVVGISVAALQMGDDEPAGVDVALAGTEVEPGASATMNLREEPSGIAVTLELEGLPPAPEGTFYEAWLLGESGKVSAGTFHVREGQDDITLWLGVDTEGYDALSVTRQPIEGGTLAEGEVVLRGELPD